MNADDERIAAELADLLMRSQVRGGPVDAVCGLTRLLRILRIVTRVVTAERNKRAYSLNAWFSQRDAAERIGVTPSTMQRWMEEGAQQVSRETAPANSNSNDAE